MQHNLPRLGVLALMLQDYEPLFPGITRRQEDYLATVLSGLCQEADFVFPQVSLTREDTLRLVEDFNHQGLDGILVVLLSYAPGQYLVRAMQHNSLPLAMALIQPDEAAGGDFGELELTVNQAIHGSQDNANCLLRAGIPCVFYAGSRHGEGFKSFIRDFGAAAAAKKALSSLKVSVIGKLPGMGDVITDDMAFYRKLGPEFVYDSIGEVTRYVEAVTHAQVEAQLSRDRETFTIDPALPVERHAVAARLYLGLKAYLEQGGYGAYTIQFSEFGADGRYTQLPLMAASHLMAEGYGYAAEGDASCAAWMAAMVRLCGEADFSEMYMMDLQAGAILLCHAGEGNWALAAQKPYLMDRVFNEGGLSNPPTPIFTPRPGRATVMSLCHLGGDRFRLVAAHGEILDKCDLKNCDMPYMFFRPDSGVETCVRRWLEEGGTHHETIVLGDQRARIAMLTRLLDVELCQI